MNDYMQAIPILEAHESSLGIEVSSYPHMKEKDQKELINRINYKGKLEHKELDAHELAQALGFI